MFRGREVILSLFNLFSNRGQIVHLGRGSYHADLEQKGHHISLAFTVEVRQSAQAHLPDYIARHLNNNAIYPSPNDNSYYLALTFLSGKENPFRRALRTTLKDQIPYLIDGTRTHQNQEGALIIQGSFDQLESLIAKLKQPAIQNQIMTSANEKFFAKSHQSHQHQLVS